MDKKIAGLVGAVTALSLAPVGAHALSATAGVHEALNVQSYAELLNPIPNARVLLRAVDAEAAGRPRVQKIQYDHHHHHHHHNSYIETPFGDFGVGEHHHHHHHHHHYYDDQGDRD